jgi:general secretion pathway protein E
MFASRSTMRLIGAPSFKVGAYPLRLGHFMEASYSLMRDLQLETDFNDEVSSPREVVSEDKTALLMGAAPTSTSGNPSVPGYLSQVLVRLGISGPDQIRLRDAAIGTKQSPYIVIARLGLAKDSDIADALCDISGLDLAPNDAIPKEGVLVGEIATSFLRGNAMLPLFADEDRVDVGVVDPFDHGALQALGFACAPRRVHPVIMALGDIERGLRALYGAELFGEASDSGLVSSQMARDADADTLRDMAREEPIVRLLDALFIEALEARASDIHIEPKPQGVMVRVRVDGALRQLTSLNSDQGPPIISRLKILAELDVANSRSPQDGRASIIVRGRPIDVRVSTVPAAYGESVAVRILDRSAIELDFEKLGLVGVTGQILGSLISKPHGLTIMTGPTGSGKTTSLYAALERVRSHKLKILTVEDPVEFRFEDVNQIQVNEAAGVTFASTLRAFLRQDPDIILVGEIRDSETARIAVQAALTGHLVLATLHTNDAASAPARLIDMGVEPYLLASVFNGAAAQRLVRRLCQQCATSAPLTIQQQSALERLGVTATSMSGAFGQAHGCKTCDNTGFKGRVALVEAFGVNEVVRNLIHKRASLDQMRAGLQSTGMVGLLEDGLGKAKASLTSLDEVLAIVAGMDMEVVSPREAI